MNFKERVMFVYDLDEHYNTKPVINVNQGVIDELKKKKLIQTTHLPDGRIIFTKFLIVAHSGTDDDGFKSHDYLFENTIVESESNQETIFCERYRTYKEAVDKHNYLVTIYHKWFDNRYINISEEKH